MEREKLCPGCMRQLQDIDKISVCPHCGYDLKNTVAKQPYHLPPYTMLGEQEKRYMLGRVVGEGAFGITYVAFDIKLEMKVAIKEFYPRRYAARNGNAVILHKQQNFDIETLREETINEARSLAKLDKLEGVVEVKEYFRDNNTIYIVMEYIEGVNLKDFLTQNGGKIQVAAAKQMMRPVMESLIRVHDTGMIHRDISPDNIMVTPDRKMKLIDFGTAKESDDTDKLALGKKGYAPPEQFIKGGQQGPWTDVYALAATYYYCIVGKKPPLATDRMKSDTLVPPSRVGVIINQMEEEALLTALNPDVGRRFQSMKALHNAFYTQLQRTSFSPPFSPLPPPPKPKSKITPVAIVVIGVVTAGVVAAAVFLNKGNTDTSTVRGLEENTYDGQEQSSASEEQTGAEIAEDTPHAGLLEEWQEEIDNGNYEDVIDDILSSSDSLVGNETELAQKLLKKAIDKEQKVFIMEATALVSTSNDYAGALDILEEGIGYMNDISGEEFAQELMDTSAIEDKYISVHQSYKTFLLRDGGTAADNGDDDLVFQMFSRADNYFGGEEYEQIKVEVYTKLVFANIGKMTNSDADPEQVITYISNNIEKTDYNCWTIEFLDFFRSQYMAEHSLPVISTAVSHVSGGGFILPNSGTMSLTNADLSVLSQYELYLAYFEIYARHGRTFNDASVTEYFSKYAWYIPTTEPSVFDESSLNEYEKYNAELIFKYQQAMGYR